MKRVKYLSLMLLFTIGCARYQAGCSRRLSGDRWYEVKQYAGNQLVNTYRFHGILNNQEHSDGYYWFVGDTLYEVSGTTVVTSWR